MLCPKGVKRYLQGSHPDRLLTAYAATRRRRRASGRCRYDEAIARVAAEIERIQTKHGNDAVRASSAARA